MTQALSPAQIVRSGLCIGCGACASGAEARMEWDDYGQLKPTGPATHRRSEAFARLCPFSPEATNEDAIAAARFPDAPQHDARLGRYTSCHVGAVAEAPFRERGSSGGMVSWVAAELMRRGGLMPFTRG